MKLEQFKEKVKDLCRRVGKRNFIILGSMVLIAAAIAVNVVVFSRADADGYEDNQSTGVEDSDVQTESVDRADPDVDTYFSGVQVSRQRSRDEAIEVLQAVVDNVSSTEAAKNEALAEIQNMARVMEAEANIESLIVAKGFEECVAVISGDSASIVVKSDGLMASEISQINEIVFEQSGIKPINVKIIER